MTNPYSTVQPTRAQIDAHRGAAVLDFGTNWCGYCQTAAPLIEQALAQRPDVGHIKVEDGPGRPLGRSFRIKLWPTVIVLKDGKEVARVVRPTNVSAIATALGELDSTA